LLGYQAASSSNPLLAFRYNLPVPLLRVMNQIIGFLNFEDVADNLSRNVGSSRCEIVQKSAFSSTSGRKPEIMVGIDCLDAETWLV